MIRALIFLASFFALTAQAHIGSPDVFYDGMAGPYPVCVTIRMPSVIPGRAEISVRVQTNEPVTVSFLPVYSWTPVTNAPPPDIGRLVQGETNLYAGELWLMSSGAYSVEVHVNGYDKDGMAQIPVTSVAIHQLPLPSLLGKVLLLLCTVLVVGGIGIAAAAGREAALPVGATSGKPERRKGFFAAATATVLFLLALTGGRYWWSAEENAFRRHLHEGAWPDLAADVRTDGADRILRLEIGEQFFKHNQKVSLIPDHGKLMHLFVVREGSRDAFAHLHPIRTKGYTFEVAMPPLPEGRYDIFCDLTFEGGTSSTPRRIPFCCLRSLLRRPRLIRPWNAIPMIPGPTPSLPTQCRPRPVPIRFFTCRTECRWSGNVRNPFASIRMPPSTFPSQIRRDNLSRWNPTWEC